MADVQVVRGLVKNDRVHTLGYRPGKEDHFPLAAGECLNVSPGKIGDFQLLHSMADDLFGGSFLFFPIIEGHADDIFNGEVKDTGRLLAHITELLAGHFPGVLSFQNDLSIFHWRDAEDGLYQRRFSAAVGADDTGNLAFFHGKINSVEDLLPPVLHMNIFKIKHHGRSLLCSLQP